MGKWHAEEELDFEIVEHRVTLGEGKRKRDAVSWECVWNVPTNLVSSDSRRQIICVSKVSKADAINQLKSEREIFLKNAKEL